MQETGHFAHRKSLYERRRLHHKNQVSAYAGRTLHGVVRRTYLAGHEVGPDPGEPRGRLLVRGAR